MEFVGFVVVHLVIIRSMFLVGCWRYSSLVTIAVLLLFM